jgi:hypothetical protein
VPLFLHLSPQHKLTTGASHCKEVVYANFHR